MSNVNQFIGFKVFNEFFGVPVGKVKEIVRVPDITHVPEMPDFMEGVINLRGKIVPIVDMRKRLGLAGVERSKANRVLIVDIDHGVMGIVVDSASEIIKIDEANTEPTPGVISSIGAEYITAIGKLADKLISLLDIEKMFRPEEIKRAADIQKIPQAAA